MSSDHPQGNTLVPGGKKGLKTLSLVKGRISSMEVLPIISGNLLLSIMYEVLSV